MPRVDGSGRGFSCALVGFALVTNERRTSGCQSPAPCGISRNGRNPRAGVFRVEGLARELVVTDGGWMGDGSGRGWTLPERASLGESGRARGSWLRAPDGVWSARRAQLVVSPGRAAPIRRRLLARPTSGSVVSGSARPPTPRREINVSICAVHSRREDSLSALTRPPGRSTPACPGPLLRSRPPAPARRLSTAPRSRRLPSRHGAPLRVGGMGWTRSARAERQGAGVARAGAWAPHSERPCRGPGG